MQSRRTMREIVWNKLKEGIQQMDGRSCVVMFGVVVFLVGILACGVPCVFAGGHWLPFLQSQQPGQGEHTPNVSLTPQTPQPTRDTAIVTDVVNRFCDAVMRKDVKELYSTLDMAPSDIFTEKIQNEWSWHGGITNCSIQANTEQISVGGDYSNSSAIIAVLYVFRDGFTCSLSVNDPGAVPLGLTNNGQGWKINHTDALYGHSLYSNCSEAH